MTTRPADLSHFLLGALAELAHRAPAGSPELAVSRTLVSRIKTVGQPGQGAPEPLPEPLPVVDRWLGPASELARTGPAAAVGIALAPLLPCLAFRRRKGADPANAAFYDGHANAMILGPGGIEERGDLWIGLTLMAPGTLYVDHDHPPEEVYLALTPGEWWNARMDWTDPGPEGLIYNPPGIRHAMRAGATPFLALWFLPI